jgi:hypothetical protein
VPDFDWLTADSGWFEPDVEARHIRASFVELYRVGSAKEVVTALEAVWMMVDRGVLWVSSVQTELAHNGTSLVDRTCTPLLFMIARQLDSLTCLARRGFDHLPTAMAAARAAFETGARLAWAYAGSDGREREIRALRLHNDQARWKKAVASDLDRSGDSGDRWRLAAEVQSALVSQELDRIGWEKELERSPSVAEQLHELALDHLYSGYRLASEFVHGGLSSAFDAETAKAEESPFGYYWPNDWYLAMSMCAWSCLLAGNCADPGFDLGPVRGLMLAAEVLALAPSPGWKPPA